MFTMSVCDKFSLVDDRALITSVHTCTNMNKLRLNQTLFLNFSDIPVAPLGQKQEMWDGVTQQSGSGTLKKWGQGKIMSYTHSLTSDSVSSFTTLQHLLQLFSLPPRYFAEQKLVLSVWWGTGEGGGKVKGGGKGSVGQLINRKKEQTNTKSQAINIL